MTTERMHRDRVGNKELINKVNRELIKELNKELNKEL